jgi:hypothetical protein
MGSAETAGLKVRTGAGEETLIGYNAADGEVWVDRTNSGEDGFSPNFPGVQRAPLTALDGKVRLHVLVDWSSVEVFADRGQRVITDQIFPAESSDGLQLFATGGTARFESLEVWPLRSIWNDQAAVAGCDPLPEPNPGQGNPNPGLGNPNPGQGGRPPFGRISSAGATTRCYRNARLGEQPSRGERAMTFGYRLTAAAPVRLTVKRRNGSPTWRYCPPRRGKQPFPYTEVGSSEENGQAGENRTDIGSSARAARRRPVRRAGLTRSTPHAGGKVRLSQFLRGRRLTPGTYLLTVASLDEAGRVTSARNVKFWVIAPKRR